MEAGNDLAWSELMDAIRVSVARRVPDRHAAEDIVQDVLVKAHAGPAGAMDERQARAWGLTVARNAVADHYRLQRRRATAPLDWDPPAAPAEATPGAGREA